LSYSIEIRRRALIEIQDVYQSYENNERGLGERFKSTLQDNLLKLQDFPFAFSEVYKSTRRVYIEPFPYHVFYRIRDHKVIVLAVIHASRDSSTWKKRIRSEK
jgi:plasmid stabilization system protein ParE